MAKRKSESQIVTILKEAEASQYVLLSELTCSWRLSISAVSLV